MSQLLEDPIFQCVISAAKGVMHENEDAELNHLYFLAGVVLAIADEIAPDFLAEEIDTRMPEIRELIEVLQLPPSPNRHDWPPEPLCPKLREILEPFADRNAGCLPEIVDACIDLRRKELQSHEAMRHHLEELRKLATNHTAERVMDLASDLAVAANRCEICPEAFAAAAWACLEKGLFEARDLAIAAHLRAYESYFLPVRQSSPWVDLLAQKDLPNVSREHRLSLSRHFDNLAHTSWLMALVMKTTDHLIEGDMRRRVAIHEAGHGVAYALLRPDLRIEKLSVRAAHTSLGRTELTDHQCNSPHAHSREGVFNHVVCILAGRAAEIEIYGPTGLNVGARSDLEQATVLLWSAIAEDGLEPDLGPINIPALVKKTSGGATALLHIAEGLLQSRLRDAMAVAAEFAANRRTQIEAVAEELLRRGEFCEASLHHALRKCA